MPLSNLVLRKVRECKSSALDLSGYVLHDNDMSELVEEVKKHPQINFIDFDDNRIGDEGAKKLATLDASVNALYLDRNNITIEGIKTLANSNIRYLNLNRNHLVDPKATLIYLIHHSNQTAIEIEFNGGITKEHKDLILQLQKKLESNKAALEKKELAPSSASDSCGSSRFKFFAKVLTKARELCGSAEQKEKANDSKSSENFSNDKQNGLL